MSDILEQLEDAEFGQNSEVDFPDDPGPSLAGRTPVVGSLRRSQGMTVLRDELADEYGGM